MTIRSTLSAIVWGSSAKHARGQKVGLDHLLEDEDGEFRTLVHRIADSTTFLQSFTSRRSKTIASEISSIITLHAVLCRTSHVPHTFPRFHNHTPTEQLRRSVSTGFGTTDKSLKVG